MNIAFEISPLLLASGSFGDKSGVYRYYYGLIKSYGEYLKKNKIKQKIILFSFNRDLLYVPINREMFDLINQENFFYLDKIPDKDEIRNKIEFFDYFFTPILKIVNKFIGLKKIYLNIVNEIRFRTYIKILKNLLLEKEVSTIYHSETSFYNLKGFKNIITMYDLTPIITPNFHRKETIDLTTRKIKFAKKYCQGIICISNSTKKDILKYFPFFRSKKILVAYPGIDKIFRKNKKSTFNDLKEVFAKTTNHIKRKRYLFFYSTFEPRKNFKSLIEAFYDLHINKKIPNDFKLVLMGGDGWGKIKLRINQIIRENFPLKNKNRIIILDYFNDNYLIDLIKNAYAVVYPSFYEGFGLPVIETMAAGTPVICSNNSSLPEAGGKAALYFDARNYYDLRNKIALLINNPRIAMIMKKNGLIQSKKFSWDKSSEQLHNFVENL